MAHDLVAIDHAEPCFDVLSMRLVFTTVPAKSTQEHDRSSSIRTRLTDGKHALTHTIWADDIEGANFYC